MFLTRGIEKDQLRLTPLSIRVQRMRMNLSQSWMMMLVALAMMLAFNPNAHAKKKTATAPTLPAAFHNNQGASYLTKGMLPEAEFEFKTAIELSPTYSDAYNNLGLVYKQLNRYDEALANFNKAIQYDPNYASAYNHLGATYLAQQKYNEALKALRQALDKDPAFADAYYNMGLVYLGLYRQSGGKDTSKLDQTEMLMKKATEINPKLIDCHRTLAELYAERGQYEKAAIRYRVALELNPTIISNWQALGQAYDNLGDAVKAKACRDEAKLIGEASKQAKIKVSDTTAAEEQYRLGTQLMEQAEKYLQDKNDKDAKRLFKEAADHLEAATTQNPKKIEARYNWGLALFQSGDTDAALQVWKKLLSLRPDYPRALYNVGMINWRKGNTTDGKVSLCRFIKVGQKEFATEVRSVQAELQKNNTSCPN